MQTEPPPRAKFSDTVNQFVIYDAYISYEAEKELQEENDKRGKTIEQNKPIKRLLGEQQVESSDGTNDTLLKSAKILERMVNQNTFNEIALGKSFSLKLFTDENLNRKLVFILNDCEHAFQNIDFKYWEDASDEFRETEGTLLPLWKFSFEQAKNLEITGLCWNPAFTDLFAASFGSCKLNF